MGGLVRPPELRLFSLFPSGGKTWEVKKYREGATKDPVLQSLLATNDKLRHLEASKAKASATNPTGNQQQSGAALTSQLFLVFFVCLIVSSHRVMTATLGFFDFCEPTSDLVFDLNQANFEANLSMSVFFIFYNG